MIVAALCITVGAQMISLPARSFTLQWQHTVEKVLWEEDYLVVGDWLLLERARVLGSGAGMEPPPDAVRQGQGWSYRPADRWRQSVQLARSEYGDDYRLCVQGDCRPLSDVVAARGPTTMVACPDKNAQ
jgi:hypothetical protein